MIATPRAARRVTEALGFSQQRRVSGARGPARGAHPAGQSPRGGWEGSGAPGRVHWPVPWFRAGGPAPGSKAAAEAAHTRTQLLYLPWSSGNAAKLAGAANLDGSPARETRASRLLTPGLCLVSNVNLPDPREFAQKLAGCPRPAPLLQLLSQLWSYV